MPFDKSTRNALARMVGAARDRLVEDLTAQLQTDYRLQPDGSLLPLNGLTDAQRAAAEDLRELLAHYRAALPAGERQPGKAAFNRLVRDIGFTILNRLAALRLSEERGLVAECVRRGQTSEGFQLFDRLTGGSLGTGYGSYRLYLYNLFDELALELGALFDTRTPLSHVFPTERALQDVLDLLNAIELGWMWGEDETIGWIYQYYNDEDERKKMRDESQAPRNSRELAVRNQFFTPRYVVEFLADNTIGRLWYEMRAGDTRLAEVCHYLVRQPVADESVPPSRPKKDPRGITMLDPAGGSGHFGLYCFDLFEIIYAEAWDDPDLGPALREEYSDKEAFDRAIPCLILAHNIHAIDIDPRAVQIAALALWLRAQRSYARLGLKAINRPRVTRVNVVTAEPMPGDKMLLDEFIAELKPRVLGDLVRVVFDSMQLAGEAGSLLMIDNELREAIASAKSLWLDVDKAEQMALLPGLGSQSGVKQLAIFDVSDVSDERFWDEAEARVLEALRSYAEQTGNGHATRRQLFAHDAAQGFAFIELCRQRYDVVLMNPPFGEMTSAASEVFSDEYRWAAGNMYAAFHGRAVDWLRRDGLVGFICSRTFVAYRDFQDYRAKLLYSTSRITAFADLGWEVLDGAQVETAALVTRLQPVTADDRLGPFFRLVEIPPEKKAQALLEHSQQPAAGAFWVQPKLVALLPGAPLCYWSSATLVEALAKAPSLQPTYAYAGLGASPHAFFFRLNWEVPIRALQSRWMRICRGGEYSPYYRDNSLVIDWQGNGAAVKAYILHKYPYLGSNYGWKIQDEDRYSRAGITFGKRNERFNCQVMPAGHIFTDEGQGILPDRLDDLFFLLGYLNSALVAYYLSLTSGLQKHYIYIRPIPVVPVPASARSRIEALAAQAVALKTHWDSGDEISTEFFAPVWAENLARHQFGIAASALAVAQAHAEATELINGYRQEISQCVVDAVPLSDLDRSLIWQEYAKLPEDVARPAWRGLGQATLTRELAEDMISYIVGCAMGRWDIRAAIYGAAPTQLESSPLEAKSICPPGMLIGPDGLPATSVHIAGKERFLVRPDTTTLPPRRVMRRPTIPDSDYPLEISWDGILVDDSGQVVDREDLHHDDIVRMARQGLEALFDNRAASIEHEVCDILRTRDLREFFRKPGSFFASHLRKYSKSRRQAPIYWPLSTATGDYTVWVYYHRLTGDTLYTIVNSYVKPKIDTVKARIDRLSEGLGGATGRAATMLRDQVEYLRLFLGELNDFQAELLRVAALPYQPNLNDGVILNAAPLHKLYRHNKWAKDCKATWDKLEAGDYDWAHIAYTIWPDRVKKACETDRSIAIAHGLESLYKGEVKPAGKKRGRKKKGTVGEGGETIELELDE